MPCLTNVGFVQCLSGFPSTSFKTSLQVLLHSRPGMFLYECSHKHQARASYSLGSFALLFSVMLLHWFGSQNWVCAVLFPPLTLIERFVIFSIVLVRVHQVYKPLFPCLRLVVRYTKFCTIQYCFCSSCFASQMPVL